MQCVKESKTSIFTYIKKLVVVSFSKIEKLCSSFLLLLPTRLNFCFKNRNTLVTKLYRGAMLVKEIRQRNFIQFKPTNI
jgi:hypothetical protein